MQVFNGEAFGHKPKQLSRAQYLGIGALAGAFAAVLTTPADVMKTRIMTAGPGSTLTPGMIFMDMLRKEGVLVRDNVSCRQIALINNGFCHCIYLSIYLSRHLVYIELYIYHQRVRGREGLHPVPPLPLPCAFPLFCPAPHPIPSKP